MYLDKIQVTNVRAIQQASLELSPRFNIITGVNGSGKTSFLESIFLLGVGRSFRNNQIRTVINNQTESLTVFGKLSDRENNSLGISRDRSGKFQIKINGVEQNKLSSLAHYLPVLVITPDSYKLLTSGPLFRRQYLDLSVFHVEHKFSSYWQRYNRLLKQRNAQLKRSNNYTDLLIWDKEFCQLAQILDMARNKEFLLLKSHLEAIQGIFLPQYRVQYNYYSGWDTGSKLSFSEQLKNCYEIDKRYGYSTLGAHKSDIIITINNQSVQDVLSRGEQKMLVNAMHIAQAKRLSEDVEKNCLLLVDDLPSELDKEKQSLLLTELVNLSGVQLFITSIDTMDIKTNDFKEQTLSNNIKATKVFHVEQGKISVIEN